MARGLLPHVGYRVRTLHGLAHDIVRERPGLVGLSDDFKIVDERESGQILQDAGEAWVVAHPDAPIHWLAPSWMNGRIDWVRRDHWPELVGSMAAASSGMAKDLQVTPDALRDSPGPRSRTHRCSRWAATIYADYQRSLNYRGAVDYDDLIRLALVALQLDPDYLQRLRHRWPYILEDEAQDSSRFRRRSCGCWSGRRDAGNWVRVGDPNQAIYETFTTASPRFLRNFLTEPGVTARELPNSGRSTQSIIDAGQLSGRWTQTVTPGARAAQRARRPALHPADAARRSAAQSAG